MDELSNDQIVIMGFFSILIIAIVLLSSVLVWLDSKHNEGKDFNSKVDAVCSDDYPVGFWFIKFGAGAGIERMTETEYALYCVK